jgi:Transposase, Mutator family
MLKVVENGALREAEEGLFELDEIAQAGARRMLVAALDAEAADYVERHRHERDCEGRALVVRNGRAQTRNLTLGVGTVEPRVNDRRRDEQGQRQRFSSRILPPYVRRSPKVAEVLPIPYLRRFFLPAISAPHWKGCWARTRLGCRRPTSRGSLRYEKQYAVFRQSRLEGRE